MTETVLFQRHWQRRDTAANWTSVNPILASGEWGVEADNTGATARKFKLGDGVTAWTALAYSHPAAFIAAAVTNGDTTHSPSGDAVFDALAAEATARDAAITAAVAGLSWKQAVRAATTVAGTLASSFENGDTIDGVVLATGDRILVKNQAAPADNGIYTVNVSGAPTRALDANSAAELVNASCYVSEGTTLADTQWTCTTNAPITVGTTALAFAQHATGGSTPTGSGFTHITAGVQDAAAATIDGQSAAVAGDVKVIAPGTSAAPSKVTPADNDELPLVDSAASNVLKKLTWANLKATLKTYFDTLYSPTGASGTNTPTSLPWLGAPLSGRGAWGDKRFTPGASGTATVHGITDAHLLSPAGMASAVQTIATTNIITRQPRARQNSAAGAGSSVGAYANTVYSCGTGGFYYRWKFAFNDTVATSRSFIGIRGGVSAPANSDPSGNGDILGFGHDASETQISFMHNDSAGTATKVALNGGTGFPTNTTNTDLYECEILQVAASGTVRYYIKNLATGAVGSGSVNTNIPTATTLLAPMYWRNNGSTATAVFIEIMGYVFGYNLEG